YQCASEAKHCAEDQQAAVILSGEAVHPKQLQGDAGNDQYGKVGGQEQQNAHHVAANSKGNINNVRLYKVPIGAIQPGDYFKLCRLALRSTEDCCRYWL